VEVADLILLCGGCGAIDGILPEDHDSAEVDAAEVERRTRPS